MGTNQWLCDTKACPVGDDHDDEEDDDLSGQTETQTEQTQTVQSENVIGPAETHTL